MNVIELATGPHEASTSGRILSTAALKLSAENNRNKTDVCLQVNTGKCPRLSRKGFARLASFRILLFSPIDSREWNDLGKCRGGQSPFLSLPPGVKRFRHMTLFWIAPRCPFYGNDPPLGTGKFALVFIFRGPFERFLAYENLFEMT